MWKVCLAACGFMLGSVFDMLVRFAQEDSQRIAAVEKRVGELAAAKPAEKTIGPSAEGAKS